MPADIFTTKFLAAVERLVRQHHTLYPRLPPQGLFLEALVERSFCLAGWPTDKVVPTKPNSPRHDLLVGDTRLSVKSETGKSTRPNKVSITKLCTTETGDWSAPALVKHALSHLGRYDKILMLRTIWGEAAFRYQLLDIPLGLLSRMKGSHFRPVGIRSGRRSLGANVMDGETRIFRVHFDGADGKCQVQDLLLDRCRMLRQWEQGIR